MAGVSNAPESSSEDFSFKIDKHVAQILEKVKNASRKEVLDNLLNVDEEILSSTRDILFDSVNERYNEQCDTLSLSENGRPALRLKDRRGDNAHTSRAEDVIDMYAYTKGLLSEIPKGPLSSLSKFSQPSQRKDSSTDCPNRKCKEMIAHLQAKVSELSFALEDLNLTKEKVEKYDDLCRRFEETIFKVDRLESKYCNHDNHNVVVCEVGRTSSNPTMHEHSQVSKQPEINTTKSVSLTNRPLERKSDYTVEESKQVKAKGKKHEPVTQRVATDECKVINEVNNEPKCDKKSVAKTPYAKVTESGTSPGQKNRSEWKIVAPSKYKLRRISGVKALTGQKPVKSTVLYVRNIMKEDGQSDEEVIKIVKAHATTKCVRILSSRIIHNRFDDGIVGCKITIPESDVEFACSKSFWPENVECRRWNVKGTYERNDTTANHTRQTR